MKKSKDPLPKKNKKKIRKKAFLKREYAINSLHFTQIISSVAMLCRQLDVVCTKLKKTL